MKIKTRVIGNGNYIEVILSENGTTIDLGIIGQGEAARLAEHFESAADDLQIFVSNCRSRAMLKAREAGNEQRKSKRA